MEIKKEGLYWVDNNKNKWDCDYFTIEEATRHSKTLINCTNCTNCTDCTDCRYCRDCTNCTDCTSCRYCTDCTSCRYCTDCTSCTNCTNCTNCTDCRYCTNCTNCMDFTSNPERIVSPKIGSRNHQTIYYWNNEKEQIVCGCFIGTLDQFIEKVKLVHKGNNHEKDYLNWIDKVNAYKQQ